MKKPESFLPGKYGDLAGSKEVSRAVKKESAESGAPQPQSREGRVDAYMDRLERILLKKERGQDGRGKDLDPEKGFHTLKEMILKSYTLSTEPEDILVTAKALYESEKRIARDRGHGAEVDRGEALGEENILERYRSLVLEKGDIQRETLSTWLDYLQENEAMHPMWFRYFVVRSLGRMGILDKGKKRYSKRTSKTVAPFPELNSEALGWVYAKIKAEIEGLEYIPELVVGDEAGDGMAETRARAGDSQLDVPTRKLQRIIKKKDFSSLYATAQVETAVEVNRGSIEGRWMQYAQDSDYTVLENDLKGKGTGWCTAEGSAQRQIQEGDFHVYYTKTDSGYDQPRVAIRMGRRGIAEVRGVNPRQELEPELVDIAQERYHDLPGGDFYDKKASDMRTLTVIYNKSFKITKGEKEHVKIELSKEEVFFLYEIDSRIESFGQVEDPRIYEIIEKRNTKEDLSSVFGIPEDRISTSREDALLGVAEYHYGDLFLNNLTSAEGLTLPDTVGGDLYLSDLTSAEGLTLPDTVGGDLFLNNLTSAEGLTLPDTIGASLRLSDLTSAEGLTLPDTIGGDLNLDSLTSAEGLTLPDTIGASLRLSGLTSAEGLTLPDTIGASLNLNRLTSAEGLTLPDTIGASLFLNRLRSAEGLTLPDTIGASLLLSGLTSAEGLTLPDTVGGDLYLSDLTSAEGLTLPDTVGGDLFLNNLTSAEGLTLPDTIGASLRLSGLTSAEGLTLPDTIGGDLYLSDLTSAEGLTLPDTIGGDLNLDSLTSAEGLTLPDTVGGSVYINNKGYSLEKLRKK